MAETFGEISDERQWEQDREIEVLRDFIDSKWMGPELVMFARKVANDETIYVLCSVEGCPFFVDANPAYADSTPELPIAEFMHLHRGDEADEARDDHEPVPGEMHELSWWRQHGPERVKERFTDG